MGTKPIVRLWQRTSQSQFAIGLARWPGSPSPSEAARGLHMVPVVGEEKLGENGVEGMFSKDMTDDKMTLEARKMS